MMDGIITDMDEVFFCFEMLKNLSPDKVLDIGMFLKRIGAVSRQAMSHGISQDVYLCGVDFFSQYNLQVYEKVYDEIWDRETFCEKTGHFDVALMLEVAEYISEEEWQRLGVYLPQRVTGVLADMRTANCFLTQGIVPAYQPVAVGEKQFAWILLSAQEVH